MTEITDDAVIIGVAAWARLRDDRTGWSDSLAVARPRAVGRTAALKAAATNKCVGSKYNEAMGAWLNEHGLGEVVAQKRHRLLLILQNLPAIEVWCAGLDEAQRRRLNHPNAVWSHCGAPRQIDADRRSAPTLRNVVKSGMVSNKNGKAILATGCHAACGDGAARVPLQ